MEGVKAVNFFIHEYQMDLLFESPYFILKDHNSGEVLHKIKSPIDKPTISQKDQFNLFSIGGGKAIKVELVDKINELQTEDYYVHDIILDTPTHGYYIGLYTIGEFKFQKNSLSMIKTFKYQYGGAGILGNDKVFYLSLRETKSSEGPHNYYLVKLDWKNNPPVILWKKKVQSAICSIVKLDEKILLGFKDGTIELWSIQDNREVMLKRIKIFPEEGYNRFYKGKENLYFFGGKGQIAKLSPNLESIWFKKLSKYTIRGIFDKEQSIIVIDTGGNYFQLDKLGNLNHKNEKSARIFTNLVFMRGFLFGGGVNGIHGFSFKNNHYYNYLINDPQFRKIILVKDGFLTGDDDGKIIFWNVGVLKILNYLLR